MCDKIFKEKVLGYFFWCIQSRCDSGKFNVIVEYVLEVREFVFMSRCLGLCSSYTHKELADFFSLILEKCNNCDDDILECVENKRKECEV